MVQGEPVIAPYKTGKYIAEIVERKPPQVLIKVLAVLKHPTQGDLHHPKRTDVPFFHQRRALSYGEKAWVRENAVKRYDGEIPDYRSSLKRALEEKMSALKEDDSAWAAKSLALLKDLEKDYFKQGENGSCV